MADEAEAPEAAEGAGGRPGGDEEGECPPQKCPECPAGLPAWMATFSDLVTLLLTFFVLLLSFAKTETAKYEAALGSIRDAFGGNVLKQGEVLQLGKSPDNSPTMLESQNPIRPFPIDFLTMEGLLDKHEINRESTEVLSQMRDTVVQYGLTDFVDIYQIPEGIKVVLKEKIYFKQGTTEADKLTPEALDKMVKMLQSEKWTVFVEGHASEGEVWSDAIDRNGNPQDAFALSAARASAVARHLINRGVDPAKISTVFYGDTRPDNAYGESTNTPPELNRRVEFIVRKTDLRTSGHKVDTL